MIKPLPIEDYPAVYEPGKVDCQASETMQPTEDIIRQERAEVDHPFFAGGCAQLHRRLPIEYDSNLISS